MILGPDDEVASEGDRVRAGEEYVRVLPQMVEPDVNGAVRILAQDEALVVIDKPAPLPVHPCGRFNRNTLEYFLRHAWAPEIPRPAHRLDANTTGVVVCTRTRHFARIVQPQFARGEVGKSYLAKVHGHPLENEFEIDAPIGDAPVKLGAREIDEEEGIEALTRVAVVDRCKDGTSLLKITPLTGRTNQIRIHLWQAGHPIVGDPVYLRDMLRGDRQTLAAEDPPMCLHAWRISLSHPISGKRMTYEAPVPEWFDERVLRSVGAD